MLHSPGLQGLIIFLVVAGIIVPVFHRARIGTTLGFLIAGVVLGPHGVGRFAAEHPWLGYISFDESDRSEVLAEFGIIILLFLLGLELSLQRLWQLRRYVLGVGLAQVIVTSLVIGLTVRYSGGVPPAGLVLGLCLALSSTAIAMQVLAEQHRAASLTGRIALSVLLLQDMMVVPILFIVGILGGGGQGGLTAIAILFAEGLAAVMAILLIGRYGVRPLLQSAVRTGSRDLIMAIALLILVSASVATGLAGMSVALGAFLAGLLLSDSEVRHNIEVDLEPFKGLLLGIFFITVGTRLDLVAAASDAGWLVLAVVVLMGVKALVLYAVARLFRVARAPAVEVALLLSQTGEFAFVVLGVAQAGHLLPPRLAAGAVAVVALSMLLTPVAAVIGRKLAERAEALDGAKHGPGPDATELEGHVIIGGCGRVGQMIAAVLEQEGVPYVSLDTNGDNVTRMRAEGKPVYYGDASRPELLAKVGGGQARAFVVTLNNPRAAEHMVSAARRVNRSALIFARAADLTHAARLVKRGALGVIPEAVEASLQLAARLLEALDLPNEDVASRMAQLREAEIAKLDAAEASV